MKFENLNRYLTGVFMFKIKSRISPEIMQPIFVSNFDVHTDNAKQKENFHFFPCRINISIFSIKNQGPQIWNEIPLPIRQVSSIHLFQKRLKIYVLQNDQL